MKNSTLKSNASFDFIAKSQILVGEKPNRGFEAIQGKSANEMSRIFAHFNDEAKTKVVVAQRPGRGGMDFSKVGSGRIFAVAADGFSPVMEKGPDKKSTSTQKTEDGMPLFSASGFYQLSSKDYPALSIFESYTKLIEDGEKLLVITPEQLADKQTLEISDEMEFEMFCSVLADSLDDKNNLLQDLAEDVNKKRRRAISSAISIAEDDDETYDGVMFEPLSVSDRSGSPFVLISYQLDGQPPAYLELLREHQVTNNEMLTITEYQSVEETIARFSSTELGQSLLEAVISGDSMKISFVCGHVMRTSVSFRRKTNNVLEQPEGKPLYGDAVYIKGALNGWLKGIVAIMNSNHPNFPSQDYDSLHFVAAPRQSEIGMKRKDAGGWFPPAPVTYELAEWLLQS